MESFFYWTGTLLATIVGVVGIRTSEEPKHTVLFKEGSIEVRLYQPQLQASVTMDTANGEDRGEAFSVLANYIFGNNSENQKINMTAPVETVQPQSAYIQMTAPVVVEKASSESTSLETMTFTMPSQFTMDSLPKPKDSRIQIGLRPEETLAVLRFTGRFTEARLDKKQQELKTWLDSQKNIEVLGDFRRAGYDAPFTLPFVRRNEVMVPIKWNPQ